MGRIIDRAMLDYAGIRCGLKPSMRLTYVRADSLCELIDDISCHSFSFRPI